MQTEKIYLKAGLAWILLLVKLLLAKKRGGTTALIIAIFSIAFVSPGSFGASPVLPLSSIMSGAINPLVTQANVQSTICVSGYTATIRPPTSYTNKLKKQQLASSYSFYHDSKTADFEEDHLISLEIGGSPASALNLWPEPYSGVTGARIKDQLENKLHALVCSGAIPLKVAQGAIASNWYTAYQKYVLNMDVASAGTSAPPPVPTSTTDTPTTPPVSVLAAQPSATSSHPSGATGKCNDGTYSFSANHRGMCSGHLGVMIFYH